MDNRIKGKDLRELCHSNGVDELTQLPGYFAHLHETGIFFRAVHLGNILIGENKISLVDISDLSARNSPLGVFQRARNLAHLFNAEHDKAYFVFAN